MSATLERLVTEWRNAQRAIDHLKEKAEQHPISDVEKRDAVERLVEAHNALVKYADEEMG